MSNRNNVPNHHGTNGDYDGSSDGEYYKLKSNEKSVLNIYLFLHKQKKQNKIRQQTA